MVVSLEVSYEQLRSLVLEILKTAQEGQVGNLEERIIRIAVQQGIATDPIQSGGSYGMASLQGKYKLWIEEIIWDLIIEGIVRPGTSDPSSSSRNLPFYHLSEYGKVIVSSQQSQPYDPDGYLSRIRAIPNIDSVIITYLEESLKAFRVHCLRAAMVTLGCASEKAVLLLIDACTNSFNNSTDKNKFEKATNTLSIKKKHDEFNQILTGKIQSQLPREIKENLEHYLSGLFSIIRTHRNDVGHPTGDVLDREELYALLVVFPRYLEKIYSGLHSDRGQ